MFILVKLILTGIEKWNCIKTIKSHRIHWLYQSSMFLVSCISVSNIWLIDTISIMHIFHQGRWLIPCPKSGHLSQIGSKKSQTLTRVKNDHRKESRNELWIVRLKSRWWPCVWVWYSYFSSLYCDMILVSLNFTRHVTYEIFKNIRFTSQNYDRAHFRKLIKNLNLIYEIIL